MINGQWHWPTGRLTDLPHAAGTGLRTHVGARKVSLGVVVSPSVPLQFRSVVLLFSPCCGVPALCSIGRGARAPLECTA